MIGVAVEHCQFVTTLGRHNTVTEAFTQLLKSVSKSATQQIISFTFLACRDRNTVKKRSYARTMGSIGPLMKSLSTKHTAVSQ